MNTFEIRMSLSNTEERSLVDNWFGTSKEKFYLDEWLKSFENKKIKEDLADTFIKEFEKETNEKFTYEFLIISGRKSLKAIYCFSDKEQKCLAIVLLKFYRFLWDIVLKKEEAIKTVDAINGGFPTYKSLYKGEIDTDKWINRKKFNYLSLYL